MNKEKVKEAMIDVFGVTVFISALLMIITAFGLSVMSVIYMTDRELIQSLASVLIAGIFIYYSIILMKQISIDQNN